MAFWHFPHKIYNMVYVFHGKKHLYLKKEKKYWKKIKNKLWLFILFSITLVNAAMENNFFMICLFFAFKETLKK